MDAHPVNRRQILFPLGGTHLRASAPIDQRYMPRPQAFGLYGRINGRIAAANNHYILTGFDLHQIVGLTNFFDELQGVLYAVQIFPLYTKGPWLAQANAQKYGVKVQP